MTLLTEPTRIVLAKGQPVPNDPNFAFNSLLLHGDGTNGSTVITDSSGSPKTVAAVGNAQISTAQSKFGGSSIAFTPSSSLTIAANSAFIFETDFTIETWAFPTDTVTTLQGLIQINNLANGVLLRINCTAIGDDVYVRNVSKIGITPQIVFNDWNHIALTRSGTTVRAFVNGIVDSETLTVSSTVNSANGNIVIGLGSQGNQFLGYIDDLRITKGVARYTANFTPPTAPFPDF
jgi:hypothetical protein